MLFLYNPINSLADLDEAFGRSFFERDLSPKVVLGNKRLLCNNEDDGSLRLTLDVPGVKESDIKVTLDRNALKIHAETKNRRFEKLMTVNPDATDLEKLSGHLADGVLTVTAPPKAKPEATQVSVTSNDVEDAEDDKKDDTMRIYVEIPGVKHSDLKVTFEEGTTLHICGVRKGNSFDKTFRVDPEEVDVTKFKANLSHGILVVEAPKHPKPEPQTLAIQTTNLDSEDSGPSEGAGKVLVSMDLPGVRIQDVTLNTVKVDKHRSTLDIEGSRNTNNKKMRFAKTVVVDHDTYDLDQLKAQLVDGVLTITAPKKPEAEPINVPIITNEVPKAIEESKDTNDKADSKSNAN